MNQFNLVEEKVEESGGLKTRTFKEVFVDYLSYWKLFVFCIGIAVVASITYLRYSVPVYNSSAKILIKNNEKKNTGQTEYSAFEDLEIFNNFNSVDNEKSILKSRKLISKVVQDFNLNIEYYSKGSLTGFQQREIFENRPFSLAFADTSNPSTNLSFLVKIKDIAQYEILDPEEKVIGISKFNAIIEFNGNKFKLIPNKELLKQYVSRTILIKVLTQDAATQKIVSNLIVEQESTSSTVLIISLKTRCQDKGIAVINKLIEFYNIDAIVDKKVVSENTRDFILERSNILNSELDSIESKILKFKNSKNIVDLEKETEYDIILKTDLNKKIIDASTENEIRLMMLRNIQNIDRIDESIDVNLGGIDLNIDKSIEDYNKLVFQRSELLKSVTEKNQKVQNINFKLTETKKNIVKSLKNIIQSQKEQLSELNASEGEVLGRMAETPKKHKEYWELSRQQKIKESLFLYLLEKMEEAQIAMAAKIGNAKVIDNSFGSNVPISPNSSTVYISFISIALFLSILYIYLKNLLRDKVYSKSDIVRLNLPYLGNIPLGEKNKNIVISRGSKTAISESFRSLRTNADFLLRSAKQQQNGNFIFITSTVAKEGKSFTAVNFSLSIALSGKKVLLLGMDLRAPKLEQYLGKEKSKGITNYIVDANTSIYDYIYQSELDQNLYIFPSGDIPPNPSELLMNTRVEEMFKQAELDFDFIIVDTPPVGIVTDTLLISHYADVTIYVVRANQLPRKMLNIASDLFKEKRLNNMAVLLNGTYGSKGYGYGYGYNYGYGYGYGYYQDDKKDPWWKFKWLFNKR